QQHPQQPPPGLAKETLQPLPSPGSSQSFADDRRAELDSRTFTSADAYYLELCAFFADAVHTLLLDGRSQAQQAQACFHWVVRPLYLIDYLPYSFPHQVLRRGRGSETARMFVFLAALERLGIPGCVLTCGDGKDKEMNELVGVLADGNIYLFDARL